MLLRAPLSLLSPAGARARLSVLIFHRVLPQADALLPDVPTAETFEQQMRWLQSWFRVLPLQAAVEQLYAGTLPARAAAITFDDGYADNEELAAPVLRRLGLTATFFISTGFLGGHCMWNDRVIEAVRACRGDALDLRAIGLAELPLRTLAERRAAVHAILGAIKHREPAQRLRDVQAIEAAAGAPPPPPLMMQPEQVRSLRAQGMDVGAHTITHPILTRIAPDAARAEMLEGKRALEALIGEPVPLFAYPNGVPGQDYAAEHAAMARDCGFTAAVSTAWGAASQRSDRYQLPRFTPWDRTRWRYGVRLLANLRQRERTV